MDVRPFMKRKDLVVRVGGLGGEGTQGRAPPVQFYKAGCRSVRAAPPNMDHTNKGTQTMNKLSESFMSMITSAHWDLFYSPTARFSTGVCAMKSGLRYFFKYLNKRERIFYEGFVDVMAFYELEDNRNSVHAHAFIRGIAPKNAADLTTCSEWFFGNSDCVPYGEHHAKYIAKKYESKNLADWESFRVNSRLRLSGLVGGDDFERRSAEGIYFKDKKRFLWADINHFPAGLKLN